MVRLIITWSLHNRLIVILGAFVLVGAGIFSALHLNIEAYPDPTPPLVEVITQNPGASPEEMERLIGIPLETALNGMPGLQDPAEVSTSVAGLNDIKCCPVPNTAPTSPLGNAARQEVINRIGTGGQPAEAGIQPGLSPWSPIGEDRPLRARGTGLAHPEPAQGGAQDWVITRALKTVPGVIDVTGYGGTVKQYQVLIDTRLLRQYNITLQQVEDAISRSNANIGGDLLSLGSQSHNVRALGLLGKAVDPLDPAKVDQSFAIEINKLEDLRKIIITSVNDNPIYLRNIAQAVVVGTPTPAKGRRAETQGGQGPAGRQRRGRRRRGHCPDAQVRAVTRGLQEGRREAGADRALRNPPQGDAHGGLQPADRADPRHHGERAPQPGRGQHGRW